MNEPTEAQIKEFWEWCGFRYGETTKQVCGVVSKCFMWRYPDGSWQDFLPSVDLNNLFKYAVPKVCCWEVDDNMLTIKGQGIPQKPDTEEDRAWWEVTISGCEKGRVVVNDEDPTLALFWALWQVKEKNK